MIKVGTGAYFNSNSRNWHSRIKTAVHQLESANVWLDKVEKCRMSVSAALSALRDSSRFDFIHAPSKDTMAKSESMRLQ